METEIQVSCSPKSRHSIADCGPALYTPLDTSHLLAKPHRRAIWLSKEFFHLDEGKRRGRRAASWQMTLNFEIRCFWLWEFELLAHLSESPGWHKSTLQAAKSAVYGIPQPKLIWMGCWGGHRSSLFNLQSFSWDRIKVTTILRVTCLVLKVSNYHLTIKWQSMPLISSPLYIMVVIYQPCWSISS